MPEIVVSGRRYEATRMFKCKATGQTFPATDGFHHEPDRGTAGPKPCPDGGTPHLSPWGGDCVYVGDAMKDLGPAVSADESKKEADAALEAKIADRVAAELAKRDAAAKAIKV